MKQTAVDWLIEMLYNKDTINDYLIRVFEQAKEMEKQQIIDAHFSAQMEDLQFWDEAKQEALEYYNETFKNK